MKTKNREKRGWKKADYKDWQRLRAALSTLREHYSWTQISNRMGKERGWAAEAYKYRHITQEHDIAAAEKLVAELLVPA